MSGRKAFTLYWTNFERYEQCPRQFLWHAGWGDIDLGRGPGRGKQRPKPDSKHHALMGIVIQAALEQFYNEEWWRTPSTVVERLTEYVRTEFERQLNDKRMWIDWNMAPSKSEMLQVCLDGVLGYLKTMKHNRLLGEYARSEVDMVAYVNKYTPIGAKADFIIRRGSEITILDGKNSKSKGKYTNPDQLRWYALTFYLGHKVMPTKIGFVYFRYPYGYIPEPSAENPEPEPESGIDWIPFTEDDLKGLAARAVEARKKMDKATKEEDFPAVPVPKVCRFCDFESVCDARQEQRQANAAKRKSKAKKEVEGLIAPTDGVVKLGFGKKP